MRRKLIFSCSLTVFLFCLLAFIVQNVLILVSSHRNEKFLHTINMIFSYQDDVENDLFFSSMEFDGRDYIGAVNFLNSDFFVPIESKCNSGIFRIQSACNYGNDGKFIIGTNLKNSFFHYKIYGIGDSVLLMNTMGDIFKFQIIEVIRDSVIDNIVDNNSDLIVIVKDYYNLKYIGFKCKRV